MKRRKLRDVAGGDSRTRRLTDLMRLRPEPDCHELCFRAIVPLSSMRRFASITAVLSLLSAMMSPTMAAACTGTGKAASCHAMPVEHCERAAHEHHHHAVAPVADPTSSVSESVAQDDSKCPMDCCRPGHRESAGAIDTSSFLPSLAVSDQAFHFVPVVFTSAGFSSHTDRGPPSA